MVKNNEKESKRNFKGVWIPREIYLNDKLSWSQKILLIEIDSLDNGEGCFASNEYFSKFLRIGAGQVANVISELRQAGLIEDIRFDGRNRYIRVQEKLKADFRKSLTLTSRKAEPSYIYNNTTNNIDKELATKAAGSDINILIKEFEPLNPSYEKFFSNLTQRKCLERLATKFGFEKTKNLIAVLSTLVDKPYAPSITTPLELENKLGALKAYFAKEKAKKNKLFIISKKK